DPSPPLWHSPRRNSSPVRLWITVPISIRSQPQAVPQYVVPQPHRPAPGPIGGPYGRHPIRPRRSRTGRVLAICLGVVLALVLGAGIFVWRDDSTRVAQMLGRSKGDKDIQAMIEAFPRMLPSSADGGNGYDDTTCRPAPQ